MQIVIMSDSHGNIANIGHVMGFAKQINADSIIHCGDWNSIEATKKVLEYKIPLYSILGNADINPEVEKLLIRECIKFDQLFLEIDLAGKRIGIIHNLETLKTSTMKLDILFYGHTHRQLDEVKDGLRIVNPGALERGISFAVYDTNLDKVELINEQI